MHGCERSNARARGPYSGTRATRAYAIGRTEGGVRLAPMTWPHRGLAEATRGGNRSRLEAADDAYDLPVHLDVLGGQDDGIHLHVLRLQPHGVAL